MFNRHKKSVFVVKERSKDETPFIIPHISSKDAIDDSPLDKFVDPIYGREVKDEIVVNKETTTKVDLYEPFRANKNNVTIDDQFKEFRKVKSLKENTNDTKSTISHENELINNNVINEVKTEDTIIKDETKDEEIIKEENPTLYKYNDEENIRTFDDIEKIESSNSNPVNVEIKNNTYINTDNAQMNYEFDDCYSESDITLFKSGHVSPPYDNYELPPLSLLNDPVFDTNVDMGIIRKNTEIIDAQLQAFKIEGEVKEYTIGPTFTRYAVALGPGVSGSKVESISTDLQRSLEADSIRVENPIRGKNLIGIEIPNIKRRTVSLKELLDTDQFRNNKDPLLIPVGLDVEGKCRYVSIKDLPHGLVAGTTNSGKSVFLNCVIASLIYRNSPKDLRLFFIDPKQIDLQVYAKMPHLLCPIVSDPKQGVASIKWLINEMERRFTILRVAKAHSGIFEYRDKCKENKLLPNLPFIVCFIDEAGDFMMDAGNEAQDLVTKLIQKCRAAGIYIFLCTQKPSKQCLSTSIKSNASGRFALRVNSQIDSQIILDASGAEDLLGYGDMIFSLNASMSRYQSAFLTSEELTKITTYCERQAPQDFFFNPEELERKTTAKPGTVNDELFEDIARYVVREGRCSMNAINKAFNIGFNRCDDITKLLEYYNIVDVSKGTKPREVLVDEDELEEILKGINK